MRIVLGMICFTVIKYDHRLELILRRELSISNFFIFALINYIVGESENFSDNLLVLLVPVCGGSVAEVGTAWDMLSVCPLRRLDAARAAVALMTQRRFES